MAAFKCIGCNRNFDDQRAVNAHKRYCKSKTTAVVTRLLQQRKINLEKKADEMRRRLEDLETAFEGGSHDRGEGGLSGIAFQPSVEEEMTTVEQVRFLKICFRTNLILKQRDTTPPSPLLRPSGRPNRKIRLPRRYVDELPPQPPVISNPIPDVQLPPTPALPSPPHIQPPDPPTTYNTVLNSYGVHCSYPSGCLSYTPDYLYSLSNVSDAGTFSRDPI
jgi:hypothetical protein